MQLTLRVRVGIWAIVPLQFNFHGPADNHSPRPYSIFIFIFTYPDYEQYDRKSERMGARPEMEAARLYLEKAGGGGEEDDGGSFPPKTMAGRSRFFESFVMKGLHFDLIEPGRILCSLRVPPRLLVRYHCRLLN